MHRGSEHSTSFWKYLRLVCAHVFTQFHFWRDMLIGCGAAIITFLVQLRWGLIPLQDWQGHRFKWIASYAIPFLLFLAGDVAWRLFSAPWRLHQNYEQVYQNKYSEMRDVQEILRSDSADCRRQLYQALANPSGPDIVFEFAARDQLRIRNLKGGAAHNLLIHSFTNGVSDGMVFMEHRFPFLAEGEHYDFSPHIESLLTGHAFGFFKLDAFVHSVHRKQPDALETMIPFTVTYWDGAEKDFKSEFEMYHNFLTKQWRITRTRKLAELHRT